MKEYILNRIGELNLRHAQLTSEALAIEKPFSEQRQMEHGIKMACAAELWNTMKELQAVLDNTPCLEKPSPYIKQLFVFSHGFAKADISVPNDVDVEIKITTEKLAGLNLHERYLAIMKRAEEYIKCSLSQQPAQLNTGGDSTVQG